jgi:hypothetical protein
MKQLSLLVLGLFLGVAATGLAQIDRRSTVTLPGGTGGVTTSLDGKKLKFSCPGPQCVEVDTGSTIGKQVIVITKERDACVVQTNSMTTWLNDHNVQLLAAAKKLDTSYKDSTGIKSAEDRAEARTSAICLKAGLTSACE